MRVLLVNSASRMGGAEWSLLELALALREAGVQVVAAVPRGPLAERLHQVGLTVESYPALRLQRPRGRLGPLLRLFGLAPACWALRRATRRVRPDVVHANSLAAAASAWLALRTSTPLVWHVRDLTWPGGLAGALARRCSAIIAISPAVQSRLLADLPAAAHGRIVLIRNGIDLSRWPPHTPGARIEARRALELPVGAPVVGMLAHLVPWKRHDRFLDMAGKLAAPWPEAHFALAGADLFGEHARYAAELQARADAGPLRGRVHWCGEVAQSAPFLNALDLLIHPAVNEPFGRAICEAMAAGVPVVAMRSAGPADLIEDGVSGRLVPPDAGADGLVQAVAALLANPFQRVAYAAAARARVAAEYDIRRTAREVAALYARCAPPADPGVTLPTAPQGGAPPATR
jgi:glycosyltransferase involved in cell wall biosynthesis